MTLSKVVLTLKSFSLTCGGLYQTNEIQSAFLKGSVKLVYNDNPYDREKVVVVDNHCCSEVIGSR